MKLTLLNELQKIKLAEYMKHVKTINDYLTKLKSMQIQKLYNTKICKGNWAKKRK